LIVALSAAVSSKPEIERVYDHRTSELGLKADAIAQFIYSAEVQAIGMVEANGMVSSWS
jgi:hypothetical protein